MEHTLKRILFLMTIVVFSSAVLADCTDLVMDPDEQGIDCGGTCDALCVEGNGRFLVAGSAGADQKPTIVSNSGLYLVSWSSRLDYDTGYGEQTYMQQFDFNGNEISPEWNNLPIVDPEYGTTTTSVSLYENNDFIVGHGKWASGAFFRKYDADGGLLIPETHLGRYTAPNVQVLGNGDFVATWMDGGEIYAQRFDPAGNPSSDKFVVNSHLPDYQGTPTVSSVGPGRFIIAWSSNNQDGDGWGVYAQLFDNDGSRIGDEFRVNDDPQGDQLFCAFSSNGERAVAVYSSGGKVMAKVFDRDFAVLASEFLVDDDPYLQLVGSENEIKSVAMAEDGRFVVVWARENPGGMVEILGQKYDAEADPAGGQFLVDHSGMTSGWQAYYQGPAVAFDDTNGRFMVVYKVDDHPFEGNEEDQRIFGKVFGWCDDSDDDGVCDTDDPCPNDPENDDDHDGICGDEDRCAGTAIPEEAVPSVALLLNRFALLSGTTQAMGVQVFDTAHPEGKGPQRSYTVQDTAGCSCEQILTSYGQGGMQGHWKYGCSISVMDAWVESMARDNNPVRFATLP